MPAAQVSQEEKSGIIEAYYLEDTGIIREDGTGLSRDFYHPGATVTFKIGDSVRYTLITTPSGKTIIAGIRKPE
ncbi:MAG: hypothetical protein H0W61_00515 [Bacteroidetes bacterium]|nr:hypothetical protein [Bacteroidota bacterium]